MRRVTLIAGKLPLSANRLSLFVSSAGGEHSSEGIECRRIGELTLASQLTFDAECEGAEIFALLDSESPEPKVSRFPLPDGFGSLYYKLNVDKSGEISYKEIKKNRTVRTSVGKFQRELIVFVTLILCIGIYFGGRTAYFGLRGISKTPANFTKGDMEITLSDAFVELDGSSEGYHAVYATDSCTVTISREKLNAIPEFKNMTALEILNEYASTSFYADQRVVSEDGLDYITFEMDFEKTYKYRIYVFKTESDIWVLEFFCPKGMYGYWSTSFNEWAKSIKFK